MVLQLYQWFKYCTIMSWWSSPWPISALYEFFGRRDSVNIFFSLGPSATHISVRYIFSEFSVLWNVLQKRFSQKTTAHVIIRLLRFFLHCFHFLLFGSGGGDRTSCWCSTSCWGRSNLQMRLLMLTVTRALANEPGQKGSTFILAALMKVLILSSVTVTSSWCRMRAEEMQAGSQREAVVRPSSGRVLGKWQVSAPWHGAGCWMKWGSHPSFALASLKGPSTLLAAGERG